MLGFGASRQLFALRQWPRDNPPFSSSPGQEPLDALDPTQRRILEFITSHPGVYLREICRELGLAMGAVQYHVGKLERDGRINSVRRGLYKFFFPAHLFGERQRDVLSVLSLDRPRELLLNIIEHPGTTQEALAGATGVSQPTVSWHLKRLIDLDRRQASRRESRHLQRRRRRCRDSGLHQDIPSDSLGEMVEQASGHLHRVCG